MYLQKNANQKTAQQKNDCRFKIWLYLDFENKQTSTFSTIKTFAV